MTTEFFPLDVMDMNYEAVTTEHLMRLEFLKGYIRNENLAMLFLAVAEEQEEKEKARSKFRSLESNLFVSRQMHEADLVWILGELKGALASWGHDEIHDAVTKERVQRLVSAIVEKIDEVR